MGHYIFSIPKRGPDGEWGCSVLGGEGDGDNDEDGDELPPYFPIIYPPNPPSLPPGYNPPPANTPPPVVWYPIILDPYNNFTIELDPDFLFNYLDVPFAWTYEGDDGTIFSDNKPNDEPYIDFHPMDQSHILAPKFVTLVKNLRSFVKNNLRVMNALQRWSGFSKQEILNKLEYRFANGPQVYVSGPNTVGVYGKYNHELSPGVLFIDLVTVDKYQQSQLNSKEEDALAFMLSIVVLHEFTHFSTNILGVRNTGRFSFKETGNEFEKMLFDVIVKDGPNGNLNAVYIKFLKK